MGNARGTGSLVTARRILALVALAGSLAASGAAPAPAGAEFGVVDWWWASNHPIELAADSDGNVYVASGSGPAGLGVTAISKYTADGSLITSWDPRAPGDGTFAAPGSIATDPAGNVYVGDSVNHKIRKFTSTGSFLTEWGSEGAGDGEFLALSALATDSSGNVYALDPEIDRVQTFSPDGAFRASWGSEGSGDGQFKDPAGIAVDPSGDVYVADTGNDRIQRFASDGTFITKWGTAGARDGELSQPHAIASDSSGSIFVSDSLQNRIQKFTSGGGFLDEIECRAQPGVIALAANSTGNLFALNLRTGRYGQAEHSSVTRYGDPGQPPDCVSEVQLTELQALGKLQVSITCLFEDCEASASGSVKAGKEKARLRRTKHSILEDVSTDLGLRIKGREDRRTIRRALEGARGKAELKIKITDEANRIDRVTMEVTLRKRRSR